MSASEQQTPSSLMSTLPPPFTGMKPVMQHNNVNLYQFQSILQLVAQDSVFTNKTMYEFQNLINGKFRDVPDGEFKKPVAVKTSPEGGHIVLYPEPMLTHLAELIMTELAEDYKAPS